MTMDQKHLRNRFTFKVEESDNGTFIASMIKNNEHTDDAVGALYYVVVVIFIYGCSILMMIASYIRKNNTDRKLNRYLKEMANVRKREYQQQLYTVAAKAAAHSRKCTLAESADPTREVCRVQGGAQQDDTGCSDSARIGGKSGHDTKSEMSTTTEYLHAEKILDSRPAGSETSVGNAGDSAMVSIVIETSDCESANEAFLNDSQEGKSLLRDHRALLSHADSTVSSEVEAVMTSSVSANMDSACAEDQTLLCPDDSEAPLDDSESDPLVDKTEVSDKLQWTDFQVISSV